MRKIKLGEVVGETGLFVDGDWVESKDQDPNGTVRLIQLADIGVGEFKNKSDRFLTEEKSKELGCTFLKSGDLLVARLPDPLGRTCVFPGFEYKCVTAVDICIIRIENPEVYRDWLMYALNSQMMKDEIDKYTTGTTRKRISRKNLQKIEIPHPTLTEQKAIVAKLGRAQRLIDIDREMLAKYDELIQSVFLEMFGDPVRNEKGWEVKPFKKVAEIDKESFDPTDFNGSVNYVGLNSIVKETGKIIDVETIIEGDVKSTKFKFSPNHILYGKLRPYLNKVAFPDFNGVCSTDILPILPKEGISTRSFIGHLLKSKEFVNYADKNSSGANLPRISPTMVKKFEAIHPPFDLQKKFEEILNKINTEKSKTALASKKSEELFSSLVQGVFN